MAGKIHKYDCYDLKKFGVKDVETVVDIGANIGTVSIMSRILFPFAKVIAIEPCKETFDLLKTYMKPWGIECYNFALGPGTLMNFVPKSHKGLHRFVSENEKEWWLDTYTVNSISFSEIFSTFNIDINDKLIIKIDCEGGERFVLQDANSIGIIQKSLMLVMELHFGFGGSSEEWQVWVEQFKDSHSVLIGGWEREGGKKIKYFYESLKSFPSKGKPQLQLLNKRFNDA